MSTILGIIKVIFLLSFLVLIHEGGHFIVAKLCKIKVEEFSLGFGKKLWSKQKGETVYSIRCFLFGGYVKLFGEVEQIDEKGSFNNAKVGHRIAIVSAGAIVNIVFGIIAYFVLMSAYGINNTTVIDKIIPEYQNEQTLLQPGDKILEINGKRTRTKQDIDNIMFVSQNDIINVLLERNSEKIDLQLKPIKLEYENGFIRYILGIQLKRADYYFTNNVYYGFWNTVSFISSMKDSLIMLFTGKVNMNQMSGPIGISEVVIKTDGLYDFLYLLSTISLSLGVTNLLPIPALDGGKLVLLILEAIRKKKIDEKLEMEIQTIGFMFLIMLSIYISINDIKRIF